MINQPLIHYLCHLFGSVKVGAEQSHTDSVQYLLSPLQIKLFYCAHAQLRISYII